MIDAILKLFCVENILLQYFYILPRLHILIDILKERTSENFKLRFYFKYLFENCIQLLFSYQPFEV